MRNEKLCPTILLLVMQLCILYTCIAHTEQRIFVFSSFYFPENFGGIAAASETWKLLR